jgi:hypothetical protein
MQCSDSHIVNMRLAECARVAGMATPQARDTDAASPSSLGPPLAATSPYFMGVAVRESFPPKDHG